MGNHLAFMIIIIHVVLIITILVASALSIFIYTQQRVTVQRTLLAIHFFSIALWALSTLITLTKSLPLAVHTTFASAVLIAVSKLFFIDTFPEDKKRYNYRSLFLLFIASIFFILSWFTDIFVSDFTVVDQFYVIIDSGPYALAYALFIAILLIIPLRNLWHKIHHSTYPDHITTQIRLLFLGTSFFFFLGVCTNSVLPVLFDIHYFNGVGPSFSLISAGFTLYIITRHHFLGLSIAIQRGMIYTILFTSIVVIYVCVLFIVDHLFGTSLEINPITSGIITTSIGIFSIPKIDGYLRRVTDPFFFKNTYNYRQVLQKLSAVLNRTISIEAIEHATSNILTEALKASAVHIILRAHDPNVDCNETGTVHIPLKNNQIQVGCLCVHQKRSGSPYDKFDKQLLKTISYQLALACERALLHKELQDHTKKLEETVAMRTEELRAAYEYQQAMLANIAHGLQTPLTIMVNEFEKISVRYPDENIGTIQHLLTSLSSFIYDLLKLSKLESKGYVMNFNTCDLSALLEDIVSYTDLVANDLNITLHTNIPPMIHVTADEKRIEETILILLNNAMKYVHPERPQTISVTVTANQHDVSITVADAGIGIPHEHLPRVFDRFYRVHPHLSERGSGLGLTIAKTIVEAHGGKIAVSSVYGIGTTFILTLPRIPTPSETTYATH